MSPAAIRGRRPLPTRLRDVRDGVVLLDLPEASDEEANRACVALADQLLGRKTPGLRDAVPGARSLLIAFDPLRLGKKSHNALYSVASTWSQKESALSANNLLKKAPFQS